MNNSSDPQNARIESNLRKAHSQTTMRPEYAQRVLGELVNELERKRSVAQLERQSVNGTLQRYWLGIATLAALLLIAVWARSWLPSTDELSERSVVSEIGSGAIANKQLPNQQPDSEVPANQLLRDFGDTIRQASNLSADEAPAITASTGYLAGKLYDDAEFEIYVILPTQKTTEIIK